MLDSPRSRAVILVLGAVIVVMIALPFAFSVSGPGFELDTVEPTTTVTTPDQAAEEFLRALDQSRATADPSAGPTGSDPAASDPAAPDPAAPTAGAPSGGSTGPAGPAPGAGGSAGQGSDGGQIVTEGPPGGPKVSFVDPPGESPEPQCSLLRSLFIHIANQEREVQQSPSPPEGDDAVRLAVLSALRERQDLIDGMNASLPPQGQAAFEGLLDQLRAFGAGTLDADAVVSSLRRFQAEYVAGCLDLS
jgi:hypothetical protein